MSPSSRWNHRSGAPIAPSFTSTAAATSVAVPPKRYLPLAAAVALAANARVYVVDYRLAPQTPFPGAFDDCLRAYHWLVAHSGADPQTLAVLGDSAGGNLAVAVTAAALNQGLALPVRIARSRR